MTFSSIGQRKCVKSDFQCGEQCISNKLVCDGNPDCADKSDETNCGMSNEIFSVFTIILRRIFQCFGLFFAGLKACTNPAYIQCHDKKCVANSSACNGVEDCAGGEDEKNCHPVSTCIFRLLVSFSKFVFNFFYSHFEEASNAQMWRKLVPM